MGERIDNQIRTELEAAAFRSLIKHLQKRADAQNIDIMNSCDTQINLTLIR